MGENFQDHSRIQDFVWKVGLKMLNKKNYKSFSDLFTVYLKTVDHLNMKL